MATPRRVRRIIIEIPQLKRLGDELMANLNSISVAIDQLSQTLDDELTAIHDALSGMQGPTQEEVDTIAQRVTDLRDKIANIIP